MAIPVGLRPRWVRLAVREGNPRTRVLVQAGGAALIAVSGLVSGVVNAMIVMGGGAGVISRIASVSGVAVGCLGAAVAAWIYLAVRWVDRHGGWATAAEPAPPPDAVRHSNSPGDSGG